MSVSPVQHHKLVRDQIPALIESGGGVAVTRILDEAEFRSELVRKLREEVAEFVAAPSIEELADIQEVVTALSDCLGGGPAELEKVRVEKRARRGGFEKRIFLEETRQRDGAS